jgi:hypothetical protein
VGLVKASLSQKKCESSIYLHLKTAVFAPPPSLLGVVAKQIVAIDDPFTQDFPHETQPSIERRIQLIGFLLQSHTSYQL